MLHSMDKELRALDDTLQEFKGKAIYAIEWGEFSTKEQIRHYGGLFRLLRQFRIFPIIEVTYESLSLIVENKSKIRGVLI